MYAGRDQQTDPPQMSPIQSFLTHENRKMTKLSATLHETHTKHAKNTFGGKWKGMLCTVKEPVVRSANMHHHLPSTEYLH